jgi:DUF4097 and DUF4098 domain-containing protein YvlB
MKNTILFLFLVVFIIKSVKAQKSTSSNLHEMNILSKEGKYSRSWNSLSDTLTLDTLFKGVKSLVFIGDDGDISVIGSRRSDIKMNYHYKLKARGIFLKKAKAVFSQQKGVNCELSYELVDSILTIHLEIKNKIFIGSIFGSFYETSKLKFHVPENISVSINAGYGDVEATNLCNKNYSFQTTGGDIKTERVNGNITLSAGSGDVSLKNEELNNLGNNNYNIKTISGDIKTERLNGNVTLISSSGDVTLKNIEGKIDAKTISGDIRTERVNGNITLSAGSGDVSLKNVEGNIDAKTKSGDIKGNIINVIDELNMVCSSGDIYCEITNANSEFIFDLRTNSGDINIRRNDLNFSGSGTYTFGKGNIEITAKSGSGDIIVR